MDEFIAMTGYHRKHAKRALREEAIATETRARNRLYDEAVQVCTFANWRDSAPGFFEIDMVEHCCGPKADGDYVHTLTLTDIASGWTE